MLTEADIAKLAELHAAATPGPWHLRFMDDDLCMGATAVATKPNTSGDNGDLCESTFHGVIAATHIQDRNYVVPPDGKHRENAELIVALRNVLPELLELARHRAIEAE